MPYFLIVAALMALGLFVAYALCRATAPRHPLDRLEDDAEQAAWVASQGWAA